MSIPGLPPLPPDVSSFFGSTGALQGDFAGLSSAPAKWGIFRNGAPVVLADNVGTIGYRQDFHISNYPQEKGAFTSYNKVQRPSEIRVRFSKGGNVSDREAFLTSISAIIGDTNLYDVVTPEVTYSNMNLTLQSYERAATKGFGLITVDVRLEEVRSASLTLSTNDTAAAGTGNTTSAPTDGTPTFSERFAAINEPQSPSDSSQVNGGNVQALTPTAGQNADFVAALKEQDVMAVNLF